MRTYVKNRVAEAREHLGPVLKELGLHIEVKDGSYETDIYFMGRKHPDNRERARCPVAISFAWPINGGRVPEAQWSDAKLEVDNWKPKPLGNTGWFHQRWWDTKVGKLEKTGKAMFTELEKVIRKAGVFTPHGQPNMIYSKDLADTYWALGRDARGVGIVTVELENGPFDALTFQDHLGRRIHMIFGGGGQLMIDGEMVGLFGSNDTRKCASLVTYLKTGESSYSHLISSPRP